MRVKHVRLKGEEVNTHLGLVRLDEDGFVINGNEFEKGGASLLELPTFIDAELFAGQRGPAIEVFETRQDAGVSLSGQEISPAASLRTVPTDEVYWSVIERLAEDENTLNSEGYVDMDVLNGKLKEFGFPILSGARRKVITDNFKNEK